MKKNVVFVLLLFMNMSCSSSLDELINDDTKQDGILDAVSKEQAIEVTSYGAELDSAYDYAYP